MRVGDAAVELVCRENLEQREGAGYLYVPLKGSPTLRHGEGDDEALESVLETTRWIYRDCDYEAGAATLVHREVL